MEVCSGGDLYVRDPYTESEAARIVTSMLSAVAYMHSQGVVHRDLKFENCLFVNTSPLSEVKLIDFGLSKIYQVESGDGMTDMVGTVYSTFVQSVVWVCFCRGCIRRRRRRYRRRSHVIIVLSFLLQPWHPKY